MWETGCCKWLGVHSAESACGKGYGRGDTSRESMVIVATSTLEPKYISVGISKVNETYYLHGDDSDLGSSCLTQALQKEDSGILGIHTYH